MTPLYLQYRATTSDPWAQVPDLTSAFPTLAVGALPIQSIAIASEPQTVTPLCCDGSSSCPSSWLPVPGGTGADDHLILHVSCPPIPLALEAEIITFLINYKSAAYQQVKYDRFGRGGYITASLSLMEAKERHGMLHLKFRLAAAMADALTNA